MTHEASSDHQRQPDMLTELNLKEARLNAIVRGLIFVVVVLLLANTTVTTFTAIQDHHRIKQNEEIQRFIKIQAIENGRLGARNQELLSAVRSCTQPGGKCYEDGQKRTASAVGSINEVSLAAAACAVGRTGTPDEIFHQIKTCVAHRLAASP